MDSCLSKSSSSVLVRSRAESRRSAFQGRVTSVALCDQLRLQAGLDGELRQDECEQVRRVLAGQADARSLLRELNLLKSAS